MSKKELVELKETEKEILTREEKIEIVKKVFEYCKKNYGLKDYTIDIIENSTVPSSYLLKFDSLIEDKVIINPVEQFKISIKNKNNEAYYVFNKLISNLNLSEKDEIKTRLIFTCLHEIGHSLNNIPIDENNKISKADVNNLRYYDKIMYRKEMFRTIGNIKLKTIEAIYKYNHKESPADYFAYSVLNEILKKFNIKTNYFDIKCRKEEKKINNKKLEFTIKVLLGIKSNTKLMTLSGAKINLNKEDAFNRYIKIYLKNLKLPESDYKLACKILITIINYAYTTLISVYINNPVESEKMYEYLYTFNLIDMMIIPKYKKLIQKDWLIMGAGTIAFVEFPRIWRELQNKELI